MTRGQPPLQRVYAKAGLWTGLDSGLDSGLIANLGNHELRDVEWCMSFTRALEWHVRPHYHMYIGYSCVPYKLIANQCPKASTLAPMDVIHKYTLIKAHQNTEAHTKLLCYFQVDIPIQDIKLI